MTYEVDPPGVDPETASLAQANLENKIKMRAGFEKFQAEKAKRWRYYRDAYGNQYEWFPFANPLVARVRSGRTQLIVRERTFKHKKPMMRWLENIYQKKQAQFKATAERKAQRAQAREVLREKNAPTKAQVIATKLADAEEHLKGLESRIKRLRTQTKKWNHRIVGLKAAKRRAEEAAPIPVGVPA